MAEHADEAGLGPVLAGLTAPGADFELVERVVDGVPMRIYRSGPHTLRELAEGSAALGDRTFTLYHGERCTFAEHLRRVAALAAVLRDDHRLAPGDRVGIAMRNVPEWSVAFFAVQCAGLVAVPLNAWWSAPELAWAVADSGARVVIADPERVAALAGHTDATLIRVRGDGPVTGNVREWADLGLDTRDVALPDVAVGPDDPATIMYTSGTTGRPKGAVGTHLNHVTNLLNTALWGRATAVQTGAAPPDDPGLLLAYPLFHIAGINSLVGAMLAGSRLATLHRWDPAVARAVIRDERLTRVAGVPSTAATLLDGDDPSDLASLTSIGMGGAPIPPELVARISRLGAGPANGYGLTETTSAVCFNAGPDYLTRPDSVGRLAPGADLRVVTGGGEGRDAAPGEVGELWFRGPNVVRGYWNNPDATAAAFDGGWFRSGDLGYQRDGWVYVVDRLKDVVLRGGENVYSVQVEAAIHDVPGVVEVAVVGVPHPTLGEEVGALVRAEPNAAADADAVRAAVTARVGAFAAPAHVRFTDEPLPRTATGKIRKRELREVFDGG